MPPIEVRRFRTLLNMPVDVVKTSCDAESLKCFMSYLIKRHNGSERRASRLQVQA